MTQRESQIESWLRDRVTSLGGLFLKFVSPGTRGVPDRIVILKGHVIFVELKRDGGKVSAVQAVIHKRMTARGADVRLITGKKEAEEFVEELTRID